MLIEIRDINWAQDKDALLTIERAAFPPEMQSDEADLKEQIKKGFGLVIYKQSKPVAYAIAVPLDRVEYAGCKDDPNSGRGNSVYVESLAVVPDESPFLFRRLVRSFNEFLIGRKLQRVSMHAETNSRWHQFLVKLGGRELGRFDNWQGWGKTFSYLEFNI